MSVAFPNTVLNTIVAEAIDELADKLEAKTSAGKDAAEAVIEIVKESYRANKQISSAATTTPRSGTPRPSSAGLKNLRTTPDALPEILADATVEAFEKYNVLSKRELESRFEVWVEQYCDPRQHRGGDDLLDRQDDDPAGGAAPPGADLRGRSLGRRGRGSRPGSRSSSTALGALEKANAARSSWRGWSWRYPCPRRAAGGDGDVREAADKLEKVVADDLWPLPKYEEMLFIK